jgi:hypothetical protein
MSQRLGLIVTSLALPPPVKRHRYDAGISWQLAEGIAPCLYKKIAEARGKPGIALMLEAQAQALNLSGVRTQRERGVKAE